MLFDTTRAVFLCGWNQIPELSELCFGNQLPIENFVIEITTGNSQVV